MSESTLDYHDTRLGVWETTCQHFSSRDRHHNLAQELPGLPKRANISTRIRDDFYWKIRRDEHHFNVDQRPLETAEVMNLSILTLTGGHWKPARWMRIQTLDDLLEARGERDEYPRWRHSNHRDEYLDSYTRHIEKIKR